jgi:beta-1,4-mannosyl-glycoprotein beta-1,4-N-acetylglucosaminyltransferase
MLKIYDCFSYFNEDLLLSLRLEILHGVVDQFVITEATHTYTGRPKPLNFNPPRFHKFSDKIIYLVIDDLPLSQSNALANEIHQRNALMRGLNDAADDDWVIISDVDEIPDPSALRRYRPWNLYGTLVQKFYHYFLNNLAVQEGNLEKPRDWIRAKITTAGHLRNFFGTPQNLRIYKRTRGAAGLLHYLKRKLLHQRIRNGGWHFSWLMTPEQMIEKLSSFSHTEYDTPEIKNVHGIREAIRNGRDIMGKGEHFRLVHIDHTFPQYLQDNLNRFRDWYIDPSSPNWPKSVV